jgi:hypothetical protein
MTRRDPVRIILACIIVVVAVLAAVVLTRINILNPPGTYSRLRTY